VTQAESQPEQEHSTKIEEATERAANTIRKAAARAAADRAHARTRTSVLAALGLVLGVIAATAVATGVLAVLGIVIGVLALLVGVGGLTATGNHHPYLAGRIEAVAGLLLAAAAIVIGILAATGALPALDTDTNLVQRLHDQLPGWLR
jgi:uncharacterized membrane protein HdeD (DUF308 family)